MKLYCYHFVPQPDITAFELACIYASVSPGGQLTMVPTSIGEALAEMFPALSSKSPSRIERHFELVETRDVPDPDEDLRQSMLADRHEAD